MILHDFKMNIIQNIQQSNLPIDAIYFVMKDIMNEVVDNYNKILDEEKIAEAAARAKTEQEPVPEESDASAIEKGKEEEEEK